MRLVGGSRRKNAITIYRRLVTIRDCEPMDRGDERGKYRCGARFEFIGGTHCLWTGGGGCRPRLAAAPRDYIPVPTVARPSNRQGAMPSIAMDEAALDRFLDGPAARLVGAKLGLIG